MTQNIEKRTEAAVETLSGASKTFELLAHTDQDVETPVGKRKSVPKITRELDEESQRLKSEWNEESQRLQTEWGNESTVIRESWQTERNELSVKSLGVKLWEDGQTEFNINQQRRWTDNHTYLPKSVPVVMASEGPDDNWVPYTADKDDILNDVFGRKPVTLVSGITLTPDANQTYPKLLAFGKTWELNNSGQPLSVDSFSETQDGYLAITLADASVVIAHKMDGASRIYVHDQVTKSDDRVAQTIIDQNGKDWFIDDGFLVTPQSSAFNIKAGAGYVSGNRVTLEFDRSVSVPNKPSFIYVDAHREGTPTGEQVTLFDFVITADEKDDYADANGVKHFVCKIAHVLGDGSVSDLRPDSWVKENFVNKNGAEKGSTVRPVPGNEKETEWYRPGIYDVSSFGDVGSDDENVVIADDAFSETRGKMLANGGGKMFMPAMRYTITAPVIPDQIDTAAKFLIKGESQDSTVIETDQDIPVIVARDQMSLGRLHLKNTHANLIGRAVTTNDGKQSKLSSHRDAIIEGFRFGVWHRYSIWNEYRNLILRNNTCNVRLSRHAYQSDNSNPEPSSGWNSWDDGWFHNALVFDNVYCQGGEVGVWGSMMCATFISCTTQGQKSDGTNNDALPDGLRGTGLLLDCGSDTARKGWNNAIQSHYAEDTDVAVHAIGQKFLDINGLFMQGGNSSNRAQSVVRADNSYIMARGICGQDYFDDALISACNNSTVILEGGMHGTLSGQNYSVDATSEVLPRGQCDLDKHVYRLYKEAGDNKSYTLPMSLPSKSVMKLYLIGMYDGYQSRFGECTIMRWDGTEATEINWFSAELTHMTISASMSGYITVELSGAARQEYFLVAQIVGGNYVSNTSIELIGV